MTIEDFKTMEHVSVEMVTDTCAKVTVDDGYWLKDESGIYSEALFASTKATMGAYALATDAEKTAAEDAAEYEGMTLEEAKVKKVADITAYDDSDAVNQFYVNGVGVWYKPAERAVIKMGVTASQSVGRESYEVTYGGQSVSVPCEAALAILAQVEVYALDCLSVTNKHKAAVEALATIGEVEAFDITADYPEKLSFTF